MNKLIRPAKQALAKKYGYKNVSVKNGRGTAWGWVEVSVSTKKPITSCDGIHTGWDTCYTCQEASRNIEHEASRIMYAAWQKEGLKPYTYTQDDGYGSERDDVLISVHYI